MSRKYRVGRGVLRASAVAALVLFLALLEWGVEGAAWRMKAAAGQSWQLKIKRGRVGATPGDAVSYEDLDASITALQQYLNMHDVQIARLEEQQKVDVKRLESIDGQHIGERLARLETTSDTNEKLLIAVLGALLGLVGERVAHHTGALGRKKSE